MVVTCFTIANRSSFPSRSSVPSSCLFRGSPRKTITLNSSGIVGDSKKRCESLSRNRLLPARRTVPLAPLVKLVLSPLGDIQQRSKGFHGARIYRLFRIDQIETHTRPFYHFRSSLHTSDTLGPLVFQITRVFSNAI